MAVSSFSNYGIQDVRDAAENKATDHAMQLYTMKDRALQERIVQRAEAAGCKAIFLTADSPVLGVRYNEWKNDFRTPPGLDFPNLEWKSADIRTVSHDDNFALFNDDTHSWGRDVPWLRARTKMEIWIKGVLCAEDVVRAVEAGVDGVIVSILFLSFPLSFSAVRALVASCCLRARTNTLSRSAITAVDSWTVSPPP